MLRTEVDRVTGVLTDPRTRFLGTRAPRLCAVRIRGNQASMALSSRAWLGYSDMGRYTLAPLSYESLDYAAGFSSEQCPEAIVAVAKSTLRILVVERLGELFNQQSLRLRYTPRKILACPQHRVVVVGEADHAAIPLVGWWALCSGCTVCQPFAHPLHVLVGDVWCCTQAQREDRPSAMATDGDANGDANGAHEGPAGIEDDTEAADLEEQWGAPKGAAGQWASCLRIVDPQTMTTKLVRHCVAPPPTQ